MRRPDSAEKENGKMPKIVVLDGHTLNPGDLDWSPLRELGDCVLYDRTPPEEVVPRAAEIGRAHV